MSAYNIATINSPTVSLSVTATSANVSLPIASNFLIISNIGTAEAYVRSGLGVGTTAVVGTNFCVPAGAIVAFRKDYLDNYLAAISSTTTTLSISCTEGK